MQFLTFWTAIRQLSDSLTGFLTSGHYAGVRGLLLSGIRPYLGRGGRIGGPVGVPRRHRVRCISGAVNPLRLTIYGITRPQPARKNGRLVSDAMDLVSHGIQV